jgi:hypothetical protein
LILSLSLYLLTLPPDNAPDPSWPAEEGKARTMVEKLTAINLLLAFGVGVKVMNTRIL